MPPRRPGPRTPRGSLYAQLDLHGLSAEQARGRAERWLRDQAARGERRVEVVTGRGNRSAGAPVLPGEIAHLLGELSGGLVESWEPAPGGGGFRVMLRPPPAPRPGPDPEKEARRLAREHPPALLLRAREALEELGVTPTPALLAAELRRLRREQGHPE